MEIGIRKISDIDIVDINGSLDTGTAMEAENFFISIINQGSIKIAVNCTELKYISSAGLRILLVAAKRLKEKGGELRLTNLNETVREVFEISGFDTIFNVLSTEEEGLKDF